LIFCAHFSNESVRRRENWKWKMENGKLKMEVNEASEMGGREKYA
jgi:hypothetical protein